MNYEITPGQRTGTVTVPASKSQAHRQLICAALSENPSEIICDGISQDIAATIDCLNALGMDIQIDGGKITVKPAGANDEGNPAMLRCKESGSTLRFLLPVVGALGTEAVFLMEGRLPKRPIGPFAEELEAHGMKISQEGAELCVSGQLSPGTYTIPGNISSQFVSGLLMALPILSGESRIYVTGKVESYPYILMTEAVLSDAGVRFSKEDHTEQDRGLIYHIPGNQTFAFPEKAVTERDWSSATFLLCMGALSAAGVKVKGLSLTSEQGDKAVLDILCAFGAEVIIENEDSSCADITVKRRKLKGITVDAAKIPDMVPALSAVAAQAEGVTTIINAGRLRIKESDRLKSVTEMLSALGAEITETEDGLRICGKPALQGGSVDAAGDHRIAMSAAVAACGCTGQVTVCGSECVEKSYPAFWTDLESLARINH